MKLLDVEAVLNRETDIQKTDPEREVLKELNDEDTRYAILSHRWGAEVGYEEMTGLMKMEGRKRDEVRQRAGYQKIIESCKQAKKGGYEWLWIDTCCIDKRSSAELSEAINSMYRWYQNAQVCYAYLNDVDESTFPTEQDNNKFDKSNGWPEWFVRGWTLQELIAPKKVEFFNKAWVRIGNKRRLAPKLERITGISCSVLTDSFSGRGLSVARIMSWAAHRKTTRVEDRAYSLMGLFGVNMPMLYGEGKKAFRRLQLEIIREFSDQSIFAWNPRTPRRGSVLAEDPSDFRGCWYIERLEPNEFVDKLMSSIELEQTGSWYLRPNFRKIATNPVHCCRLAWLRWRARALSKQLCTFTVSNAGIQVCLPVVRLPDSSSHFRAILACSPLVAIDLLSSGSSFDRIPRINTTPRTYPEFKTLYLAHHQDVNEKCPNFILDDEHASYYGFTRCGAYPREFTGDAVTLSPLIDDLIVVVYANKDPKCYFAVGLGYHYGQEWVHVDYDRDSPNQEDSWTDFGRRAHARIWKARAIRAQDMEKHGNVRFSKYFVKHAHLPRSIWAARVVWGKWGGDDFKVMVDVVECPGCCDGPCRMTTTFDDCRGLAMPGLMETVSHSYSLELDGRPVEADECSGQRIALGDYGDYFNDKFIRTGNIYEEKRTPGIDLEHPTNCPVIPRVSSSVDVGIMDWMTNQGDLVVTHHFEHTRLALYQPQAFSLPANKDVSLLLKALSTRLSGKYLVTTIIQCSDFYTVDDNVSRRDLGGDSAPDDGNHSTEARNLTPLCIVAFPQVWSREPLREQRKERFKNIRKHFYALLNTHQLAGTLPSLKSVNRMEKVTAIKFFEGLFGLKFLRNYIGAVTFFEKLPYVMETSTTSVVQSVGTGEEDGLRAHPPKLSCVNSVMRCSLFRGGRQITTAESDPRSEIVLPLLLRLCQGFCRRLDTLHQYPDERQRMEGEIKLILQTLGVDLLEHIMTTFHNGCCEHEFPEAARKVSPVKYDRQLDTPSMVEDIKALQVKLNATNDEDEQRALEEDVTGKILWLLWCGICAEVDELLPKVINYIWREGTMRGLWRVCMVNLLSTDTSDDQAHLRRVMYDAGADISKYQLWLDARAREQAKWSGTNRGTPTLDDQGTTPSTSRQTPSTPAV